MIISCNTNSELVSRIDDTNIKGKLNKPLNLVFVWTTWCGVSKNIIKETYTTLQNDSNKYNIILLCGNDDPVTIVQLFKSLNLKLNMYIISNASNYFPLVDRRNVKAFILNTFHNTSDLELNGNFGIPISLLVDSSLNIINNHMPQDTLNIRNVIEQYKEL